MARWTTGRRMVQDHRMDDRAFAMFMELHRGLPRQGPGSSQSTQQALGLVPDLPLRPRIVDIGCGPGAQTLDLLDAVDGATVAAVDNSPLFLEELRQRAQEAGVSDRVSIIQGDMVDLPDAVHPAYYHLVWSEGAAYIMGFDAALRAWRHLLVPGGFIAVSELAWLGAGEDPPEPARAFFEKEYPAMRSDADNQVAFEACGYELSGSFVLPASDWWQPYYNPLLERVDAFEDAMNGNEVAQAIARETRDEIDVFREFGSSYGYVFYVGRMR